MKKVELLAPAGNFDCLKAAINNGADAVYLGGKNFSARAFANNFDNEELKQAIEYAHLRGVRVFVTLNTLLNEKEFTNALKMAEFYYENKVDALLIQDLGLYYVLKNKYPDFELHCSTQMHVHNLEGVKTAKKLGFKRVVLARESDIDLIRECCKEDIEIEVFVHGAICVSYSGQCLMSSYSKNRSANKGMCAQCCRLKYDLIEDGNKLKTDTDYLLSPRDNCYIDDIPELIEAGVSSFKIEGRMKSPAYVGYVTRLYRKAIDEYYAGNEYKISEDELDNLKVLFNRNFTDDFLYGKNNIFGQKTPNHLGIEIGEVVSYRNNQTYIKLTRDLHQFDGIRINDSGCIVNRLYKDGLLVSEGKAGDIVSIDSETKLSGKVFKTLDYLFEKEINETPDKKLPLEMELSIYADKNVSVELKCLNDYYSTELDIYAQKALKAPLNKESVYKQMNKLNNTEYYLNEFTLNTDNAFLSLSQLNEIRRQAISLFNEYRLNSFRRTIVNNEIDYLPLKDESSDEPMYQIENRIIMEDKEYPINYVINNQSKYVEGAISEFGGILKDYKEKIGYYTLNVCNSYTYEFLKKLGFERIILSSELKDNEIDDLVEAYRKRNNLVIKPYKFVSGNRVLMYIRSDPFGKYTNRDNNLYLSDGNNEYKVRFNGEITELSIDYETTENDNCSNFIIK